MAPISFVRLIGLVKFSLGVSGFYLGLTWILPSYWWCCENCFVSWFIWFLSLCSVRQPDKVEHLLISVGAYMEITRGALCLCVYECVLASRHTDGQEDSVALIHFLCWRRTGGTGNNISALPPHFSALYQIYCFSLCVSVYSMNNKNTH